MLVAKWRWRVSSRARHERGVGGKWNERVKVITYSIFRWISTQRCKSKVLSAIFHLHGARLQHLDGCFAFLLCSMSTSIMLCLTRYISLLRSAERRKTHSSNGNLKWSINRSVSRREASKCHQIEIFSRVQSPHHHQLATVASKSSQRGVVSYIGWWLLWSPCCCCAHSISHRLYSSFVILALFFSLLRLN